MLKLISLVTILYCISGLNAANYFYSPYSNKIQQFSKPLQAKQTARPEMPTEIKQQFQQQQILMQQKQQQQPSGLQQLFPTTRSNIPRENFCAGRNPEDKIPHPTFATKFIVCHMNGEFDIMDCPSRTVFNTFTFNCETSPKQPKGCLSNPCMNNGQCVDMPNFQYKCECRQGFAGRFCETTDACSQSPCGPDGMCIQLALGMPVKNFCVCQGGATYGLDCGARTEPNPCAPNEAEDHFFPSKVNPSVYVHCEGHIPHLQFCPFPLVYSTVLNRCDWTAN